MPKTCGELCRTTQYAVQLVDANNLVLNKSKPLTSPGRHQIVCRVEAVGLCFSDLKLIKQFSSHPRKMEILSGIAPAILQEIPSYVPGDKPTVPGHETVVRVEAVGDGVETIQARPAIPCRDRLPLAAHCSNPTAHSDTTSKGHCRNMC